METEYKTRYIFYGLTGEVQTPNGNGILLLVIEHQVLSPPGFEQNLIGVLIKGLARRLVEIVWVSAGFST
jgi:hypothetical protein